MPAGAITWRGSLHVGFVSVPVVAYSAAAADGGRIRLHQLHRACRCRIQHQKTCPRHGPVTSDQIVMGYPCAKDQYVTVDLADLDKLRPEGQKRAIGIDAFVGPGQVTPLCYAEKHYYLLPEGPLAQRAFAVLHGAMSSRNVYGVGQVVLRQQEQLVLVRPHQQFFWMTVLKYASQVRRPDEIIGLLTENTVAGIDSAELALAEALVDQRTSADWDWTARQDAYTEKLRQLIEANAEGKELAAAPASEPSPVSSLLEALQASVASGNGAAGKIKAPAGRRPPQSGGVPRNLAASARRRKAAKPPTKAKARRGKSTS